MRSDKFRGEIVIKVFGMHEKWSLEDSLPIRSPATVKITLGARKVLLVPLQADLSGGVLKQGDCLPPLGGWVLKPCSYEGVLSAVLLIGGQEEKRCSPQIPCLGISTGSPSVQTKRLKQLLAPGL